MGTELSPGFEHDLGTLLVGVDALWGGDVKGSAADRFILDHWVSGKELPSIYDDSLARELRKDGGGVLKHDIDQRTVVEFVEKYALGRLPFAIKEFNYSSGHFQRAYVEHLVDALSVMLSTALAWKGIGSMPSFDERRRAATGEENITLVPVEPLQEQLRLALDHAGVDSMENDTRKRYLAWQQQRVIPPEHVGQEVNRIKEELFARLQERFFARYQDTFGTGLQVQDLTLLGHTFRTTASKLYTGFNQYDGGEDEQGRLRFTGLFEFNVDHLVTREDLYHLTAHEVVAHYVSCMIRDASYRAGRHGIESTMGTMCSPEVALEEGLAETMLFLLYGSREAAIEEFGPGMEVVLVANDLENAAKYNVGILHLREGMGLEDVKTYVKEQCLLDDAHADKMSRVWAWHPIFAPMYGPAYHYGARVVRAAAQHLGHDKVLRWAFHLDGLLDIQTFDGKASRALLQDRM